LYTSVKRTDCPMRSCGTRAGTSPRTATALVTMSTATIAIRMGQKKLPLLLRIFLALLAVDAIPRVRQRIEALEGDVFFAIVALAERLGRFVEPSQRLIDMPEETTLLAREQERLLAFHGIGALVGHVEGVGAEIPVRRLIALVEQLVVVPQLLQHAPPLLEQPLLEMLQ